MQQFPTLKWKYAEVCKGKFQVHNLVAVYRLVDNDDNSGRAKFKSVGTLVEVCNRPCHTRCRKGREREVGVDKRSFPLPSGIGRNLTELEKKEGKINNGWSSAVHMPAAARPTCSRYRSASP